MDEPWIEPRFTPMGGSDILLRRVGQQLGLPDSQIEAAVDAQTKAPPLMSDWYLAGLLAIVFLVLFIPTSMLRERVRRASEAD